MENRKSALEKIREMYKGLPIPGVDIPVYKNKNTGTFKEAIKAIDTLYNGNYFRSRLEARWAVFFDSLRIKYEYEPEGFRNDDGGCYLPDFYLPDTHLRNYNGKGVYIEIKPTSYDREDIPSSSWFKANLVLFKGLPYDNLWDSFNNNGYQLFPDWDDAMALWICKECGVSKIEFIESNYDYCPSCEVGKCDNDRLKKASLSASIKRFEHLKT